MRYELEHCRMWFDGPAKEGYLRRMTEKTVAEGTVKELKQKAASIKLKGNKYYREELRIIEIDEYGDIIDYVWTSEKLRKVSSTGEYKTEVKTIAGKQYDYVFCPKCEIWVQVKTFNFKTGEHPDCERFQKSKEIRKRAEGIALGGVRKVRKRK